MRTIVLAGAAALAISSAFAQSPPPTSQPGNSSINKPGVNNSGAPVEGANSFTETQAKSKLQDEGFAVVGSLTKDDKGIWRGQATKNGKAVSVSVDFQGNVNAR